MTGIHSTGIDDLDQNLVALGGWDRDLLNLGVGLEYVSTELGLVVHRTRVRLTRPVQTTAFIV